MVFDDHFFLCLRLDYSPHTLGVTSLILTESDTIREIPIWKQPFSHAAKTTYRFQ